MSHIPQIKLQKTGKPGRMEMLVSNELSLMAKSKESWFPTWWTHRYLRFAELPKMYVPSCCLCFPHWWLVIWRVSYLKNSFFRISKFLSYYVVKVNLNLMTCKLKGNVWRNQYLECWACKTWVEVVSAGCWAFKGVRSAHLDNKLESKTNPACIARLFMA